VVYSAALARVPRELVEYVVVHELTHLKAHGHGEDWKRLMDMRLPEWRLLRRRLR
jgi:predicted metal-dependent hydrolase